MPRLLVLGGTGEARALAAALDGLPVITSLAGRTPDPLLPPGAVRIGGFGGTEGLTAWLRAEGITAVIDATHPFAARISANAVAACEAVGIPRLALIRGPWTVLGALYAATAEDAAARLPELGQRVFLALGSGGFAPFRDVAGVTLIVRAVSRPAGLPPGAVLITGRGPFGIEEEEALLRTHAVDLVIARDSGGTVGLTKLDAARRLSVPVLLLRRPAPPPGPLVSSVAEAAAWAVAQLT